jgi:hypothetical protein
MTSFHEVRFPDNIAYGATGGPEFATTVVATGAGHEKRNVNWAQARGRWDVASGLKKQAQIDELIAFFRARRGKAYGFRFKDWTDYKAKGIALRQLHSAWLERTGYEWRLPWTHVDLEPSDVVQVALDDGTLLNVRILETELGARRRRPRDSDGGSCRPCR